MTIVVTSNVAPRFRGFLASCMLEIAPGVYTGPHMTRAVRERVWNVCKEWHEEIGEGSIIMTWRDESVPGYQRILTLGEPSKELYEHEGFILVRGEKQSS